MLQRQLYLQRTGRANAAPVTRQQRICSSPRLRVACWAHESQRPSAPVGRLPPQPAGVRQQLDGTSKFAPSVPLPMRRLAQGLVTKTLAATSPHLKGMAPRHALLLLDACVATGCAPEQRWLEQLYAAWPVQDAAAPQLLPHTLHLLSLLGAAGIVPPTPFLDTIYFAVGARCRSDFQVHHVTAFLTAASRFAQHHPLDRDLMLSLTSALMVNEASRLRGASAHDVAALLPSVVAAGHAPGMPLTAAVLVCLQPHLGSSTPSTPATQLPPSSSMPDASPSPNQPPASATSSATQTLVPSPAEGDLLPIPTLLNILEAAVGPAAGAQLPAPLEPASAASAIAARLQAALPSLSPSDTVRAVAAMAACKLPPCPQPLLQDALAGLIPELQQLQPRQLSALIIALKRLEVVPDYAWVEAYHAALCAQLGRFDDSDVLVEALDALTAMDRQMGFRALNQLAQSTAASTRKPPVTGPVINQASSSSSGSNGNGSSGISSGSSSGGGGSGAAAGSAASGSAVAGLANTLLLLSYLNHNPGYEPVQAIASALQPHLPSLTGQQLTNVLWALARMGRTPSQSSWLDQAKEAASRQLRGGCLKPYQMAFVFGSLQSLGAQLDAAWVDEMLDSVRAQLPAMPSHDVALVLHTVSRLQHVTSYAWMADVESHVSMRLESYQPKDITTVLYAMAKLHHRPPSEWLQAVEDTFLDQLPSFSPDNQVTLLSSLLGLGHTPGTVFLDSMCTASQTQLTSLSGPELVTLLSSLGKVRYQPETEWLARYLSVLHYHLPLLDASAFASVVQSLFLMEAQVSSDEWWAIFCHAMRPRLASMQKEDLLTIASALPVCGLRSPPAQWSQALAERVLALACSGSLTSEEAERMVVALGGLGVRPPPQLLDDFLGASLPRLSSLPPNRITRLVDSFCRGGVLPSRSYLEGLVTAARASVYSFTMLELHELTQGLSQLNSRSPQPVPAVSDFLAMVKEWL